jgi:hypothetical protein
VHCADVPGGVSNTIGQNAEENAIQSTVGRKTTHQRKCGAPMYHNELETPSCKSHRKIPASVLLAEIPPIRTKVVHGADCPNGMRSTIVQVTVEKTISITASRDASYQCKCGA